MSPKTIADKRCSMVKVAPADFAKCATPFGRSVLYSQCINLPPVEGVVAASQIKQAVSKCPTLDDQISKAVESVDITAGAADVVRW